MNAARAAHTCVLQKSTTMFVHRPKHPSSTSRFSPAITLARAVPTVRPRSSSCSQTPWAHSLPRADTDLSLSRVLSSSLFPGYTRVHRLYAEKEDGQSDDKDCPARATFSVPTTSDGTLGFGRCPFPCLSRPTTPWRSTLDLYFASKTSVVAVQYRQVRTWGSCASPRPENASNPPRHSRKGQTRQVG